MMQRRMLSVTLFQHDRSLRQRPHDRHRFDVLICYLPNHHSLSSSHLYIIPAGYLVDQGVVSDVNSGIETATGRLYLAGGFSDSSHRGRRKKKSLLYQRYFVDCSQPLKAKAMVEGILQECINDTAERANALTPLS